MKFKLAATEFFIRQIEKPDEKSKNQIKKNPVDFIQAIPIQTTPFKNDT
ncbi:MAG: hypothetical protein K8R25_10650 [Methanosarcinales archaeon]|nr:hypothetical protein [Methanosarcinales archaeon]